MFKRKILIICMCLSIILAFGACAASSTTGGASSKPMKVKFADAGWDSLRFHNAVAMYIGKIAYNIDPEEISGTTPITYGALKSGDLDVDMEIWSDTLAGYDEDVKAGAVKELSVNFDDNAQGFYVPRYVIEGDAKRGIKASAPDLKTVEDLKKYSTVFKDPDDTSKGRIYGAISGWEVDKVMRKKYSYYGLDKLYNYTDPGSDAALAAAISSAYEKGQPIVAYYWEPTWITGKYDLVLLQDAPYDKDMYYEGKTECPSVRVTVCVSNNFYKKAPEFVDFLSKYKTSSKLTAEALSYIQDNKASYEDTAKWFLKEHDELITEWLPEDKADIVRKDLNK